MLHLLFLLALIALLPLDLSLDLTLYHLAVLPLAFFTGIQVPVLMHNCMHGNLRWRWANLIAGELSSFFALTGLEVLRLNHALHHAHSDTANDPHNPAQKSFFAFFLSGQFSGAVILEKKFYRFHGKRPRTMLLFKCNIVLHYAGHLVRLWAWALVLGPEYFVSFYLPAFATYSLAFAHVNYVTHRRTQSGEVEIVNMEGNAYYRFINKIGSGIYFHKNHHRFPWLLNPMHAEGAGGPR
ncbi:MAG TPA: fatty acid desaturase [Bacteriovoracaceae bacterium]|nr:fatty acid desaturase [Bacteriovoracaceae bacterium]